MTSPATSGRSGGCAAGPVRSDVRLTLLGIGAMNSPRYRPAGLLLSWRGRRVMFDGGGAAVPASRVDAWLVSDEHAELMPDIRRRCRAAGMVPRAAGWDGDDLHVRALPVVHTGHPAYGYLIEAVGRRVAWAPEFWRFPSWATALDLMFADAAGWTRPIHFAGGVGGHASVRDTAEDARRHGVRRLVFAHLGRPAIRAQDEGRLPAYGEWGVQGRLYRLSPAGSHEEVGDVH